MNIIKKAMFLVLLAFSPIASQSAFADGASDVQLYCSNCHGLTVNGVVVAGNGGRIGTQRPAAEWLLTIERMTGTGAYTPIGLRAGMADYLASIPPIATTSTSTVTSTTTTTRATLYCYRPTADGLSYLTEVSYQGFCSSGTAYSPPPPCPGGTLSIVQNHAWLCTTLCNTFVNGTTQYPYSGKGSCHSFAIDDMSGAHIVRDQAYCKKHMSHLNSKGNHVHAYPHPACM